MLLTGISSIIYTLLETSSIDLSLGEILVGKRAVLKAVALGKIKCVVLADDVDANILRDITMACLDKGVKIY